ncbi:MAG: DUF1292 domain-containing protein [Clostridia bacterium]
MDKDEELKGCTAGCASCSGCGHDNHAGDELPDDVSPVITLTDEEGNDVKFEILDIVVLDDEKEYLVAAEADTNESETEDVEVVILEIKQVDGEEVYDTVTDDKIADEVFERFTKQQEDDCECINVVEADEDEDEE